MIISIEYSVFLKTRKLQAVEVVKNLERFWTVALTSTTSYCHGIGSNSTNRTPINIRSVFTCPGKIQVQNT